MKWNLARTNVEKQLLKTRNKRISQENLLDQINDIFREQEISDVAIIENLTEGDAVESNNFNFDLLESERIFHLSDIEKICIDYRLRFLDSKYFKGEIPYDALIRIKEIEKNHNISLKGFKIIAPSKLFKLENADDPLLMAPMGNDYFYLVHKWGGDLHPLRKTLMWPFKTLENFAILLLATSFLLALMVPEGMFSYRQTTAEFFMIFFFIFKWIAGLAIFFGFKKGKNFSSAIWRSKYYNA
ncbi:hypothetical protein [Salegentibacter chungangensis]|uniref:Uncharacterized protein n=1 Tax=Salegentibacter chungangensis TaxID=1335724 RepID=A0ABW3NQQ1_9FLAO